MKRLALAVAFTLLAVSTARAQYHAPAGDQQDMTLDAATRRAIIDSLVIRCRGTTCSPIAQGSGPSDPPAVRPARVRQITSAQEFADSLTRHLRAVTRPAPARPLSLRATSGGRRRRADGGGARRRSRPGRLLNFGFDKAQRLPGNVGYIELRSFSDYPEAQPTALAAMQFLGNCDALIFDLRRNGGGSPNMIATLLTYLVEPDRHLHFNDFYQRRPEGDVTEPWWTSPSVPGSRFAGKPVYVLTSPLTGSAAEEFAYDVQTHKLGTLVGAVTAGGANPGGLFRLNEHFAAFIATGRAINPVTKTNWEGVGVQPDVAVKPEDAVREAHVKAITALLEKPRNDEHRALLQRALNVAQQTPSDKPEDYVRRGMRAGR
jgi:hypothetical protein